MSNFIIDSYTPFPEEATYTEIWSQTSITLDSPMSDDCGSDNEGLGQRWTTGNSMIGKVVNKVEIKLKQTGSPSNNVTCYVVKADGTLIPIGTIDAGDLSGSYEVQTFISNSNSYALQSGDAVAVAYPFDDGVVKAGLFSGP